MERMEAGQAGATAIGIAECSHAPPGLRLTGRGTGLVQVMVPGCSAVLIQVLAFVHFPMEQGQQ